MDQSKDIFDYPMRNRVYGTEHLPGKPFVEIFGNTRVIIENHKGIKDYSNEEIHVCVKKGIYSISGTRLKIARVTNSVLVVVGIIESVRFCGGNCK